MDVEKFCLECLTQIFYDTTEHHYCCDCFAVKTILDEDEFPSLEYVPPFWIETDIIPKLRELYELCRKHGEQLPRDIFDAMVKCQ